MVRIGGKSPCRVHPLSRSRRFFERDLDLPGGLLQITHDADHPSVEIEFAAFGEDG
jgi:hypothetical protein